MGLAPALGGLVASGAAIREVHEQRTECARRVEALLAQLPYGDSSSGQKVEHRDVDILRSLPGAGRVVSATVFAEASLPLKDRDYHAFRALAGVAPVTQRSGKQGQPGSKRRVTVHRRYACNSRLRNAIFHWARVSSQRDEASRKHYDALRKRGHTHGRALRGLGDRLLRILFAMLRSRTLYQRDHRREGSAQSLVWPRRGTKQHASHSPDHSPAPAHPAGHFRRAARGLPWWAGEARLRRPVGGALSSPLSRPTSPPTAAVARLDPRAPP